jgi:CheY-like chemotaxis protein
MLVEDEVDIRNIVKVMFQVWGHSIIEFSNGNDAFAFLDKVEAGSFNGDLPVFALMDIRMPGPNGNEIARKIRQTTPIKDIPIILMTAFQLSENEQNDYRTNYGVDRIIFKPLPDLDKLHSLIQETIATKQKEVAKRASQNPPELSLGQTTEVKADIKAPDLTTKTTATPQSPKEETKN